MANSQGWKAGRWKAVCDRCGFRFHSDKLRLEWDGLRVCNGCYETRNPQDFLKVVPEQITPPWTRPEPPDANQLICFLWTKSAYADLATADCAQADNNLYPYLYLLELRGAEGVFEDIGQLYLFNDLILFGSGQMEYS